MLNKKFKDKIESDMYDNINAQDLDLINGEFLQDLKGVINNLAEKTENEEYKIGINWKEK